MNLTKQEKQVIKQLLKQHIEEIDKANDTPNLYAKDFMAETSYELFLRNLLKKIK